MKSFRYCSVASAITHRVNFWLTRRQFPIYPKVLSKLTHLILLHVILQIVQNVDLNIVNTMKEMQNYICDGWSLVIYCRRAHTHGPDVQSVWTDVC